MSAPKGSVNLNGLALEVAKLEGGRKQMSIAQIKECIKCTLYALGREIVANEESAARYSYPPSNGEKVLRSCRTTYRRHRAKLEPRT